MEQQRHKKKGKTIVKIVVLAVVTVLSVFYVLHDDPVKTFSILRGVDLFPFLLAVLVVFALPFLDALSLSFFARLYNKKYKYGQGFVNTLIGNFIACINKTGSMFIQAYTFTKQGIKGAHAASILTMQFLMYQFTFTLFALIMVFVGYPYVVDIPITLLGGIRIFPLSLIGLSIAVLTLTLIVVMAFCKPLHHFLMNTGIDLLSKLHILKDPDETRKRWTLQLVTYRIEIKRLSRHGLLVFVSFLTNAVKMFLTFALPYFLFLSIGLPMQNLSFLSILSGSNYLQLITSFIVVGAPEVGFQSIFGYLLSSAGFADSFNLAAACNLLWRLLTFYLPLILGALCYFFYRGAPKKYELLSNTATIYDLEVLNLSETDDRSTKEFLTPFDDKDGTKGEPLLTDKDVRESFARIRKHMQEEPEIEAIEMKTLSFEEQKKQLAKAVLEAEDLKKMFSPDPEVVAEVQKDLKESYKHEKKKKMKKYLRSERKRRKIEEKERRYLEKVNPKGTKVTIDEKMGLDFDIPEFIEERTYTTSDETEDRDRKGDKR